MKERTGRAIAERTRESIAEFPIDICREPLRAKSGKFDVAAKTLETPEAKGNSRPTGVSGGATTAQELRNSLTTKMGYAAWFLVSSPASEDGDSSTIGNKSSLFRFA